MKLLKPLSSVEPSHVGEEGLKCVSMTLKNKGRNLPWDCLVKSDPKFEFSIVVLVSSI